MQELEKLEEEPWTFPKWRSSSMQQCVTPSLHRFKNVIFEISPSEAVGVFDVKAKLMGVHLETLQIEYQVLWPLPVQVGMRRDRCSTRRVWSSSLVVPGSAAAAVRRRGRDEALRQGHHQRQPAHLPAQQEVLWEIEKKRKDERATDTDSNHKTHFEGCRKACSEPSWLPTHSLLHFSRAYAKCICVIFYSVDHHKCFIIPVRRLRGVFLSLPLLSVIAERSEV